MSVKTSETAGNTIITSVRHFTCRTQIKRICNPCEAELMPATGITNPNHLWFDIEKAEQLGGQLGSKIPATTIDNVGQKSDI